MKSEKKYMSEKLFVLEDRTTLIRRRVDVMMGSPIYSKKSRWTWNICEFKSWELLVTSMVFTYPTWTIILPTLWIQSENVDIKMQVRDTHANEHTALKRLGGYFTDRKKGWRCSLDRISKVYRYRHQKTKLKIKFHLYLSDSCHQKIKKYVTWGLKSQKFYVYFLCNPMEPFISGVRPSVVERPFHCGPLLFKGLAQLRLRCIHPVGKKCPQSF